MPATTDRPRSSNVDRAREALDTLVELGAHVPDIDGTRRSAAISYIIRHKAAGDAPIWLAINALLPPPVDEDPDLESEKLRTAAESLLMALWDAEYERRDEPNGIALRTFEKLRRAHAEIGTVLDVIRLEA